MKTKVDVIRRNMERWQEVLKEACRERDFDSMDLAIRMLEKREKELESIPTFTLSTYETNEKILDFQSDKREIYITLSNLLLCVLTDYCIEYYDKEDNQVFGGDFENGVIFDQEQEPKFIIEYR